MRRDVTIYAAGCRLTLCDNPRLKGRTIRADKRCPMCRGIGRAQVGSRAGHTCPQCCLPQIKDMLDRGTIAKETEIWVETAL